MEITKLLIHPSYRKDNGLWVLHLDTSLLPKDFHVVEQSLVSIPPQEMGGNHKHPRQEAFIATTKDLLLYWIDGKGERHKEAMFDGDILMLFIISPNVPHAVVNTSKNSPALLYEFANDKQHDVDTIKVV